MCPTRVRGSRSPRRHFRTTDALYSGATCSSGDVLLHERRHAEPPAHADDRFSISSGCLQAQCTQQVGLVDYRVVGKGANAIRDRMEELRQRGVRIAIVDAISNDDLISLGPALKAMPLVTAGSGIAIALPANFGIAPSDAASDLPRASGRRAIVSGSCSLATQRQVQAFIASGGASFRIDPLRATAGVGVASQALAWAEERLRQGPVLIYSTAQPDEVKAAQEKLGAQRAGAVLEQVLAEVAPWRGRARRAPARDCGRRDCGSGGTGARGCGAADRAADRPWRAMVPRQPAGRTASGLHLRSKSGNFGADDFFTRAFAALP